MNEKTEKFKEAVEAALGCHLVGVVDKIGESGQLAFCTDEADKGEASPAEWTDAIRGAAKEAGVRVAVMPFPVDGKLVYVAAGLDRAGQANPLTPLRHNSGRKEQT